MLEPRLEIWDDEILHHVTSKGTESTVGSSVLSSALSRQLQGVLQTTRALQDICISRVVVAFTAHLNVAKSVHIIHICPALPLQGQERGIRLKYPPHSFIPRKFYYQEFPTLHKSG